LSAAPSQETILLDKVHARRLREATAHGKKDSLNSLKARCQTGKWFFMLFKIAWIHHVFKKPAFDEPHSHFGEESQQIRDDFQIDAGDG